MNSSARQPELTVEAIESELKLLRNKGLWPAVEQEKLPLLSWLALQVALKGDQETWKRLQADDTATRRQAAVECIAAVIKPAAADLPGTGKAVLSKLFAVEASSAADTSKSPERMAAAAKASGHSTSHFERNLVRSLIRRLAELMHERYQGFAGPEPTTQEAEETTEVETDQEVDGYEPTPDAPGHQPEQSPETDSQVVAPASDEEPLIIPPPTSKRWRRGSPLLHVLGAVAAVVAIVAVGAMSLELIGRVAHLIRNDCGSTTAHKLVLDDPESSFISMYAPRETGAQGGWVTNFTYGEGKRESIHAGTTQRFAIGSAEKGRLTTGNLIARAAVHRGASIKPGSVCLYRYGNYSNGTRYSGSQLTSNTGLQIGKVKAGEVVYVTFEARLPAEAGFALDTYGAIGPEEDFGDPEWIEIAPKIRFETIA